VIASTLARPASAPQRIIAGLLIAISLGYLLPFVPRGWVPHDEGMIGQSAERVLRGDTPHVDYEEPYTGGLTWLYAAVFRLGGVDVLTLRWLLFAGASLAQLITYSLLRRYHAPVASALISWVSLVWSFPNFFAELPSWWILICALCCLWSFVRYVETGTIWHAALAGLATGVAIAVKQTGVYLLVALVMSLLYQGRGGNPLATPVSRAARVVRSGIAVSVFLFALALLRSRLAFSEMLYLLLPVAACSRLLLSSGDRAPAPRDRTGLSAVIVAVTCAALPFGCFAARYVFHRQVPSLVKGLLILPQKRLMFASMDMPSAISILLGVPLVALLTAFPDSIHPSRLRGSLLVVASGIVALTLSLASVANVWAYQIMWQSSRAFAALLPLVISWRLISGHIHDISRQRMLFALCSMLAWASLVQFPFSAPIYFCYVAPLAIVAAAAAADVSSPRRRLALGVWASQLVIFAVMTMNRGYVYNLGFGHAPQALNVSLDLPRAHLRVSAEDALTYRRLVALVDRHAGGGHLIAGPDCPEVYFLTGRFSPSGTLFDFFSDEASAVEGPADAEGWAGASVIVLNHQPAFSPDRSSGLMPDIRKAFPSGESVGKFEVRWR
jgi:hypothetical protein